MKHFKHLVIALIMALALSSCVQGTTTEETKESITEENSASAAESVSVQQSEASQEQTEESKGQITSNADEITVEETVEEVKTPSSEEPVAEETQPVPVNDPSKFPPKVTLSGNEQDHLITTDYCYVEGEKFYLLFDKDANVPGDFANNIALIMDTLEEKTGLTFATANKYDDFAKRANIVGDYDPWEDFDFGQKVPIYIIIDHDDTAWVSHAMVCYAYINRPSLYDEDFCNKSGLDYSYYRGFIEYDVIAHELTHVLTQRHIKMNNPMTEGSADYFAIETLNALAENSESFRKCAERMEFEDASDYLITPENAEEMFRTECANNGDIYSFGRMLCTYLAENYGKTFLHDFVVAAEKDEYGFGQTEYRRWPFDVEKFADEFQKFFGADVFRNYGAYMLER